MILYKYFPPEKGEAFLDNPRLNFTPATFFNDPFEVRGTYPIPSNSKTVKKWKEYTDNIYRHNYYILSLTRSPLNTLMWSHYSNSHTGYVIGINTNLDALLNIKTCTIPVQFGNVIYTKTKPQYLLSSDTPAGDDLRYDFRNYSLENSERLSRFFLYKSLEWAYEEEVRVVKLLGNIGLHPGAEDKLSNEIENKFVRSQRGDNARFELNIPASNIFEIYLGVKNNTTSATVNTYKSKFNNCKIYKCNVDSYSWALNATQIQSFNSTT